MDLRVGQRIYDLRFWRDEKRSRWEVLKGDASRIAQRDFATCRRVVGVERMAAAPHRDLWDLGGGGVDRP
jgi:hypothetical protein